MAKIRIPSTGISYEIETDLDLKPGQEILVNADQLLDVGIVSCTKNCPKKNNSNNENLELAKFIRILTPEDILVKNDLKTKSTEYLQEAQAKVYRHGLDMKILDADLSFDQKKLTFYFSADNRIDFRALVSDMVGSFRKIIRLQQVGPRQEAKYFGGFGKCGRPLCCSTFLSDLDAVGSDTAAIQDLAGGKLSKMSGCCGKLMCCLSYEADIYQDMKAQMPKLGSEIKTNQGDGKVVGYNLFEKKVILENAEGKKIEVQI